MTVTVRNIVPRKIAETINAGQYTASGVTVIDKFTATNFGASDVTFSAHLPASGGSASTSNVVISSRSIGAGETYLCPELVGQVLEPGGFISTIASAATLVISGSGREIS